MATEVKHTPGPWSHLGRCIVSEGGLTVARITDNDTSGYDCPSPSEALANAAFIVKAVNSHDALAEALWNMLGQYSLFVGPDDAIANAVKAQAIAALAAEEATEVS